MTCTVFPITKNVKSLSIKSIEVRLVNQPPLTMVVINGAHACNNEAIFSSLEISTPSWQVVPTAELNTFHTCINHF
jgi:hypothetical protein